MLRIGKYALMLFFAWSNSQLFGQTRSNEFYSSEEIDYYKNFDPSTLFSNQAQTCINDFKRIPSYIHVDTHWKGNPFQSIVALTTYEKHFDSLLTRAEYDYKNNTISQGEYSTILDSLMELYKNQLLGPIAMRNIIAIDTLGNIIAILYKSNAPESLAENIWIALSYDKGNSWKSYYMGFSQNQPLYIKPFQKVRLFASKGKLQIEASLISILKMPINYTDTPLYALKKDPLLLTFAISDLIKDTDKDGLTDVFEKKINTNPSNSDTDADGITDEMDKNPRYSNLKDKYAQLGAQLINKLDFILKSENDTTRSQFDKIPRAQYNFFIIEDERLRNLSPGNTHCIVFSRKEYEEYIENNMKPSNVVFISKMFSIDKLPGIFKINIDCSKGRLGCILTFEEEHWLINFIE